MEISKYVSACCCDGG